MSSQLSPMTVKARHLPAPLLRPVRAGLKDFVNLSGQPFHSAGQPRMIDRSHAAIEEILIDDPIIPGHGASSCLPATPAARDGESKSSGPGRGFVIRPEVFDDAANAASIERRRWPSTAVAVCTWLYVAAVLVVWLLLRFAGDRWWFATVMLFGPRWLCAVPLAALVPAAALFRRRMLWVLGATAIVVVGPIMGLCLPWARLRPATDHRFAC